MQWSSPYIVYTRGNELESHCREVRTKTRNAACSLRCPNIEEIVLSTSLYDATLNYLLRQKQYAEELGITVCVLFHVSYTLESIINLRVADGINALMACVGESSSLLLLLENTVASLDMGPAGGYKEPLSYILKETDAAQVRMCFDLCHYQASKNVLLEEYTFPANWCDRIYQVHFSDTKNNEGYRHIAATMVRPTIACGMSQETYVP